MNDNRQKLLNKIRALLSKTIENGCTESEAMAALNMAQAMMDAYEVTEDDLKLEGEKATVAQSDMRDPHNVRRGLATAVARFTDCKVWTSNGKKTINFCGLQSDVDFAVWLVDTLSNFVIKELSTYLIMSWQVTKENKRLHINGFVIGCCNRINARLTELHEASKAHASKNANALVVVKTELINVKMADLGLSLRTPRNRRSSMTKDSYAAGKAAGDRASFGRPVNGTAGTLRLK